MPEHWALWDPVTKGTCTPEGAKGLAALTGNVRTSSSLSLKSWAQEGGPSKLCV